MDSPTEPAHFEDLPADRQAQIRETVRQQTELAYRHLTPVIIASALYPPPKMKSASGFLVKAWGATWLGTAWHVVEEYLNLVKHESRTRLQVGDTFIDPRERRMWSDTHADVVLVEPSSRERAAIRVQVHEPAAWPPPAVTPGSYVLVSGFPAGWRQNLGPETAGFNALSMRLRVTTVGETYFTCQWEREHLIDLGPGEPPRPGIELDGISGAPVFAERPLHYPLVGLVKLWGASTEVMYVAALSHLPEQL